MSRNRKLAYRALAALSGTWLLGGGVLVAVAPGAGAVEVEPITYVVGEEVEVPVDVTMAQTPDTVGFELFIKPGDCGGVPWCAEIPLRFEPGPGGSIDNDYLVRLSIDWEDHEVAIPEPAASQAGEEEATTNDVDVYLWELRPQFDDDTGEPEMDEETGEQVYDYEEVNSSGSLARPESMLLYSLYGDYVLTINNYYGVNTGFTVTFHEFRPVAGFEDAFQIVGQGTRAPVPSDLGATAIAPPPSGRAALGEPPRPAAPPAPTPALEPLPIEEFGVEGGGLGDLLEGGEEETRGSLFDREELGPPEPVSASVAAIWLGGVPIALLGLAAALVLRYRTTGLSFTMPGRNEEPTSDDDPAPSAA